jgi:hypothetical protein
MSTDTAAQQMTEAQREKRRAQARKTIEEGLRQAAHEWVTSRGIDFALASDIAMDALGDTAAEILVDGTMLRGLDIKDGVATLSIEPATEILQIFVASMRGVLDERGAENYLEAEWTDPSVSLDLQDGSNPNDSYTVTIQRRTSPTPHEFRQRAEAERNDVLRIVGEWAYDYPNSAPADALDLVHRLEQAGHTIPGGDDEQH